MTHERPGKGTSGNSERINYAQPQKTKILGLLTIKKNLIVNFVIIND